MLKKHTQLLQRAPGDLYLATTPSLPASIIYLSRRVSPVHSKPSASPSRRCTQFATSAPALPPARVHSRGTAPRNSTLYEGTGLAKNATGSSHLCPLAVVP
uniref:Uncharacterized protein n=1 Tax=Arundo donax TaxID=35708 RepID=A0A0A9FPA2_ARUDO